MRARNRSPLILMFGAWLVIACTDGGPAPNTWQVPEAAASREDYVGYEVLPERERLPDPPPPPPSEIAATEGPPRLELVELTGDDALEAACSYAVEARGFPAIDDAGVIVQVMVTMPSGADGWVEDMTLKWFEPEATRSDAIYDRLGDEDKDDPSHCEAATARVQERVTAANRALAARRWRPLEHLDAYLHDLPHMSEYGYSELADQAIALLSREDRPIEVFQHGGWFIARVRGFEVLQKVPTTTWERRYNPFCTLQPNIDWIDYDPHSGAALVHYNFSSGGCLCDDDPYLGRLELSPELLAAAQVRSTIAFMATLDELRRAQ